MRPRLLASAASSLHPPERAELLRLLLSEADGALRGHGRVVLLSGAPGSGKSAVLREIRAALLRHPLSPTVVSEACATDGRDVWLRIGHAAERRRRLRRAVISLLPDWISFVPVAGKVLSAVTATAVAVARRGEAAGAEKEDATSSAPAAVRDLLERRAGPLVVLLDRGEEADAPDLAGMAALVRRFRDRPIFLVVAAVPGRGPYAQLRELVLEAERVGRGRRLEVRGTGPLPGAPTAPPVLQLALPPEDIALLTAAARQGRVFRALPLARESGVPELELEDRLARLARAGILEAHGMADHTGELTSVYSFRHTHAAEQTVA